MEFVIYDQFHWNDSNHLEQPCSNWKEALARYRFLRDSFPGMSLGLKSIEDYIKMKESLKQKTPNTTSNELR